MGSENFTKQKFIQMIEKTRTCNIKAQQLEKELFEYLDECFDVDLEDIKGLFCNADNLKDAILCYCNYGEYSSEGIYEKLKLLK